jgi:hypothetical protein
VQGKGGNVVNIRKREKKETPAIPRFHSRCVSRRLSVVCRPLYVDERMGRGCRCHLLYITVVVRCLCVVVEGGQLSLSLLSVICRCCCRPVPVVSTSISPCEQWLASRVMVLSCCEHMESPMSSGSQGWVQVPCRRRALGFGIVVLHCSQAWGRCVVDCGCPWVVVAMAEGFGGC